MENRSHVFLLVFALVGSVNSQSYPRFEFRGDVLVNNTFIVRGAPVHIGEGHNDSLHCVTDNSDCCSNGEGNWYDETGGEVYQGPDGDSTLYVTRGDGVVYLNRRRGGSSGMWRCDIPDSMVYSRASTSTLTLLAQVYSCVCGVSVLTKCPQVNCHESEANEDPPEFTLTCQSRGGPVTEVEWRRNGVRVEEDSNHMTSQIIVSTSNVTVYNNTLRVRGRESGRYMCIVSSELLP